MPTYRGDLRIEIRAEDADAEAARARLRQLAETLANEDAPDVLTICPGGAACGTCDGSGTDEDGADCDCQRRGECPQCGEPIEYVEPTKTDETYRRCEAACGWTMS